MKKLANRYVGIALIIYAAQVVVAFIIGSLTRARWTPESGVDLAEMPTPVIGGTAAVLVIALYLLFGWLMRIVAYIRLERSGVESRTLWRTIAIAEGVYAVFNLAILWAAAKPMEDGNFALVFLILGAGVTTIASIVIVALVFYRTRKQTLHGLHEE